MGLHCYNHWETLTRASISFSTSIILPLILYSQSNQFQRDPGPHCWVPSMCPVLLWVVGCRQSKSRLWQWANKHDTIREWLLVGTKHSKMAESNWGGAQQETTALPLDFWRASQSSPRVWPGQLGLAIPPFLFKPEHIDVGLQDEITFDQRFLRVWKPHYRLLSKWLGIFVAAMNCFHIFGQ